MGLYDSFGPSGGQLKIFRVPLAGSKGVVYLSGGSLCHYKIGDEVTWHNLVYNYSPDFLALDIEEESSNVQDVTAYFFRAGKFEAIYDGFSSIPSFYDMNMPVVLDYWGLEINVTDNEELFNYLATVKRCHQQRREFLNHWNAVSNWVMRRMKKASPEEMEDLMAHSIQLSDILDYVVDNLVDKKQNKFFRVSDLTDDSRLLGYYLQILHDRPEKWEDGNLIAKAKEYATQINLSGLVQDLPVFYSDMDWMQETYDKLRVTEVKEG